MTEGQWLYRHDPERMLDYLRGRASERKLILFAVACCRRVERLMTDPRSRRALDVAERHADGAADAEELYVAHAAARSAWTGLPTGGISARAGAVWAAAWAARQGAAAEAAVAAAHYAALAANGGGAPGFGGGAACCVGGPERAHQAAFVRCIFGNPFLPVRPDPSWLVWNDGTVRKLARVIYDDRAYDRLPLLADALEDAGCDCWEILDHCRNRGAHVRGCWAVDMVLGVE